MWESTDLVNWNNERLAVVEDVTAGMVCLTCLLVLSTLLTNYGRSGRQRRSGTRARVGSTGQHALKEMSS